MNVLSLFDGISCGQIALNRAGIKYENYFASEIDKHAIKVTQTNYPKTIQLGDVTKIKIKTFLLSEVGSILGVNSIYDTNLQNIIPEWEMLYWLNKKFHISTTVRAQKSNERQKLQSSDLQCVEEIWFRKCGMGDIIKTRDIEGCRKRRNFSDKREYSELQCDEWWYVYRSNPRNSEEDFGKFDGEKGFRQDERKVEIISGPTISNARIERKGITDNEESNERPNLEREILIGTEKDKSQITIRKEERDRKKEESNPLQDFARELQRRNETDRLTKINGNILSIYKETQATMVESENRLDIFLGTFELICGGSPCQGFSFAGKQLNFEDVRSKLFFEFVRLLEECKPTYFLLENVRMKKEHQDVISKYLKVKPILINSSLVSGANRNRLYWTNIPNIIIPVKKNIILKDVINKENKYEYLPDFRINKILNKQYARKDSNKILDLNSKVHCLTRRAGAGGSDEPKILFNNKIRILTPIEWERLFTVPEDYTKILDNNNLRRSCLGNGWTVDVITHIFSFIPK